MKPDVLIVDDVDANRYLLKCLLEGEGWKVRTAANGREALELARTRPPDLIVSDILMPVMDGYALCRAWKLDETFRNIPFVFYTATYTEARDERFALDLGADRFLIKPQDPQTLIRILNDLLEERKTAVAESEKPLGEEMEFFRRYNDILFGKLEKKMSDLQAANRQLAALEETYRLNFGQTSDIIFATDADFRILSMSPSVERILGYGPETFIGRSLTELHEILPRESFGQALERIRLIPNGGILPPMLYRLLSRDGTPKHLEVSSSPIVRGDRIIGLNCIARDVTERKSAEDALKESERRYREFFTASRDCVFITTRDGKWIDFNDAAMELFGYDRREDLNRTPIPELYVDPDERAALTTRIETEGFVREYPVRLKRRDGSVIDALVTAGLRYDANGQRIEYYGTIRDVTESKRTEESLRRSEEDYRSLFENASEGIYRTTPEGRFLMANQAMARILGYDTPQALINDLTDIAHQLYLNP